MTLVWGEDSRGKQFPLRRAPIPAPHKFFSERGKPALFLRNPALPEEGCLKRYWLVEVELQRGWISALEGLERFPPKVERIWGKSVILFPATIFIMLNDLLKVNKIRILVFLAIKFQLAQFLQKNKIISS